LRYVQLGRYGPRVSALGIGFWQVGSRNWVEPSINIYDLAKQIILKAYEHGITLIDTAEVYGNGASEAALGEAMKSLKLRDYFVVATKVAGFRTSRDSIVKAIKGSCRRLGSAPDVVQYHWPPPLHTRLCSVIRGLEDAIDKGLASYIAVSNFSAKLLLRAIECTRRHEIVSNQVQYSLAFRVPENKLKPFMERHGIALIAWSPLAKGALAGAKPSAPAQRKDKVFARASKDRRLLDTISSIAKRYQVSMAAIALSWLISKRAIPIPGLRRPSRIADYVKAVEIQLDENDVRTLDKVSEPYVGRGDYSEFFWVRLIPAPIQLLLMRLAGGI
jgi:aryl-alcohol dehydrogenase-like predicted oxidoreductase